jgi:hypothetical protein
MTVADRAWLRHNLGADYEPPTETVQALTADRAPAEQSLLRQIIDFDSEGSEGESLAAQIPPAGTTLKHFVDIDWPTGLAPKPTAKPTGPALPAADVLIVTWTVDEAHALSRVLTPGLDSQTDWLPYTENYMAISADMRAGCPGRGYKRLGLCWTTKIGSRTVTLVKSDSHMSQDGPKLPNQQVWAQWIADTKPRWVISTGTGGGIGADTMVGDVLVSPWVTFDCKRQFKKLNGDSYQCPTPAPVDRFAEAETLFGANAQFLPATNSRPPKIITARSADTGILTTDFFGFDDSDNTYQLQGHSGLS